MSFISDIQGLMRPTAEPYSARATIAGGQIDPGSTALTGDRNTDLFRDPNEEMGKDAFLHLLVTQLKFQDPLNPIENAEFVAQLAQFRSLESSDNIEKAIGNLDKSFKDSLGAQEYAASSMANSSAVSLIGKEVRMRQTEVRWNGTAGETVPVQVHLGNSSEAKVFIMDEDGEVVRTIVTDGKDDQNSAFVQWDGTTDQGQMARAGSYGIYIEGQEQDASRYAFVQDTVTGVRFTSNGAMAKIAGKEISIGDVLDVSMSEGQSLHSLTPATALSLLGKSVTVHQDGFNYRGRDNEQHSLGVMGPPNQILTVEIRNSASEVVWTESVPTDSTGRGLLEWNGATVSGRYADVGEYRVSLADYESTPGVYTFFEGAVDGLANLTGEVQLKVQGRTVRLSDILDISEVAA